MKIIARIKRLEDSLVKYTVTKSKYFIEARQKQVSFTFLKNKKRVDGWDNKLYTLKAVPQKLNFVYSNIVNKQNMHADW